MNRSDALRLARDFPDECERQLEFLPFVSEFRSSKGAYLRAAIEQGFSPPTGWDEAQRKRRESAQAEVAGQERRQREAERKAENAERTARLDAEKARIQAEEPEAWTVLQTEAERSLPPLLRGKPTHVAYQPALQGALLRLIERRLSDAV